tara:strand:- start:595 stop:1299 length:705 start_codon:yes stop_codon:yes gene_type:complete
MTENLMSREEMPKHIAIIMDGNGRWAEAKGQNRSAGHVAGAKSVKKIVERCVELGIKYLTLYSFSTENWSRPQAEIDSLMELLLLQLASEVPDLASNGIRLRHFGSRLNFSEEVLSAIDNACYETKDGNVLTLGLALDYSGRSELIHAIKLLQQDQVEPTVETIESRLYTAGIPNPDLLIRTAGEMRISNFLLWQIAYSEIYVTEECWPDFDEQSLDAALRSFASRNRKFGKVK